MAVTGLVLFVYVLVHMLGEPAGLRGRGAARPLRGAAARAPGAPVGGPARAARGGARPRRRRAAALGRPAAGAPGRLPATTTRRARRPPSRTMIWSGFLILGFVVYHLLDLTFGVANPDFRRGRGLPQRRREPSARGAAVALLRGRRRGPRRSTSGTGSGRCSSRSACRTAPSRRRSSASRRRFAVLARGRVRRGAARRPLRRGGLTMGRPVDAGARRPHPGRAARAEVGAAQVRAEAREPREQAASTGSSWSGPGSPAAPPRRPSGELGYEVLSFCFQDSPRRAHSIAAQGGINAAKNYQNDGDSVLRLFYDTVKGGDFRSREANVYRLAELSVNIIDQCAAQGVPFAREYGGALANRSFGGALVSRTFYARGQTGQQLLLGAYQALERQVAAGTVTPVPAGRDARARGGGRARARRRGARPRHRAGSARSRRTRWCSRPAGTATSSTSPRTPRARTRPRSGAPTARARSSRTPATRRSTRPASRAPASTSRSSRS